jgi:hypothetical protein
MRILLLFFAAISAVGLLLSVASHLAALAGIAILTDRATRALHVGVFVVWFPAVLSSSLHVRHFPPEHFWEETFRGGPPWMKKMTYGFGWYAVLNFVIFFIGAPSHKLNLRTPPEQVRMLSGHWMVFCAGALAILYAAAKRRSANR